MTASLPAPPLVGERQTSTHDCGPAALASNLQWAGRTDTEPDVVDWMTARGLDNGATSPQGLAAYLSSHGVPVQWDYGNQPMSQYIPAAFARGHLVIGLHQCAGTAEPVPVGHSRIAHWRVFYADDAGVYRTMNPWEPELEALYQVTFAAADLKTHVEVMLPVKTEHKPEEDELMFLATAGIRPPTEGQDPRGQGAIYLVSGTPAQPGMFKRWISGTVQAALPKYEQLYGQVVQNFDAFTLDRIVELPAIDTTSPTLGWTRS